MFAVMLDVRLFVWSVSARYRIRYGAMMRPSAVVVMALRMVLLVWQTWFKNFPREALLQSFLPQRAFLCEMFNESNSCKNSLLGIDVIAITQRLLIGHVRPTEGLH
jgi:hypothetical protein